MNNALEIEILKFVRLLNKEEQKRLRNYLASLVKMPGNRSDKRLAKWAGLIDDDSILEMQSSIDDEFGKLDKNEW